MKTIVPFFTFSVDADVKAGKFTKKTGKVPILLSQTHDHNVFHYKFLLKSLDIHTLSKLLLT
jgi:hypothetical protein